MDWLLIAELYHFLGILLKMSRICLQNWWNYQGQYEDKDDFFCHVEHFNVDSDEIMKCRHGCWLYIFDSIWDVTNFDWFILHMSIHILLILLLQHFIQFKYIPFWKGVNFHWTLHISLKRIKLLFTYCQDSISILILLLHKYFNIDSVS